MNDETIQEAVARALAMNHEWFAAPVDLERPILGPGDDYEPELLWYPSVDPCNCAPVPEKQLDRDALIAFDCSRTAELASKWFPGYKGTVMSITLEEAKTVAVRCGLPQVELRDADLNVLKTWPV